MLENVNPGGTMNVSIGSIWWLSLLILACCQPSDCSSPRHATTFQRTVQLEHAVKKNFTSEKAPQCCASTGLVNTNSSVYYTSQNNFKYAGDMRKSDQKFAHATRSRHAMSLLKRLRREDTDSKNNNTRSGRKKSRVNNGRQPVKKSKADPESRPRRHRHADLSLWIDEQQVKLFSGLPFEIHVITDGHVQPYILDPNFEKYLPVIPAEVGVVNFTWKAGDRKYFYHFDRLQSFSEDVLLPPVVSVDTRGRIPRNPKAFSVYLPCSGQRSGVASFIVGLLIETRRGKPLGGMPLRLRLRKECSEKRPSEPDPECDRKCANGGWCNKERVCQCPEGYMGPYCHTALCYPQCMNGGTCVAPGVCDCPKGFHGLHCEGGICGEKCENGGKCIQKDTCDCPKGFYGNRCEHSKCSIPCLNKGKCVGINACRCPPTFSGNHCEIGPTVPVVRNITTEPTCTISCVHGECLPPSNCRCYQGYTGRRCQKRI